MRRLILIGAIVGILGGCKSVAPKVPYRFWKPRSLATATTPPDVKPGLAYADSQSGPDREWSSPPAAVPVPAPVASGSIPPYPPIEGPRPMSTPPMLFPMD